jgi:hypothetical protein
MGQVSLAGVLVVGPSGSSVAFPGSETTIPLVATTTDYAVASPGLANVASSDAYVDLVGVGATGPVTAGRLLYVRTEGSVLLRLTTTAGVAVVPVAGLCLMEFPEGTPLTKLEVIGTSRIEYLVAGQE